MKKSLIEFNRIDLYFNLFCCFFSNGKMNFDIHEINYMFDNTIYIHEIYITIIIYPEK